MDLKEFVSETLKQIFEGVKTAQDDVANSGGKISPSIQCHNVSQLTQPHLVYHDETSGQYIPANKIDFDVALTTAESSGKGGKAGVTVWGIGAGVEGKTETTNSAVSRVKFSVSVILPLSK